MQKGRANMVNLKQKPFYLTDDQIKWVQDTIASMTIEEKIGQLFINLTLRRDPEYLSDLLNTYHIGGTRWQGGTLEEIYEQNRFFQENSKIPLLIAANCESGGNGAVREGTLVATSAAAGACQTPEIAGEVGRIGGIEAKAIGCNWTFAPVSDVLLNWRNTIVNTRSFGDDPDAIIARCKAYMAGMRQSGIACCTKHFPGDGSEERDQHLLLGCNDLSCEQWDATFGKVYRALIDEGIESFMIGHICQPAYSRRLRPGIRDEQIMPATLAPELLNDLLRERLGFNGLILTDASHMGGMTAAAPRSFQVPGAIAAGCDMYLFFNDPQEDFHYMMDGYKSGLITEERLSDALHRILGLKAKLGLNKREFPAREGLSVVGCASHRAATQRSADESITLVKDTQRILPVDVSKRKRVALFFIQSAASGFPGAGADQSKQIMIEELERAGFAVTANADPRDASRGEGSPYRALLATKKNEQFKKDYDLALMVINMKGYAQENNVRLRYNASHSGDIPWYAQEVPTIGISLNYTNHLIDVPMLKTFINGYSDDRVYIRAIIEKIVGKSQFKGQYNELVWCGRWETRL